MVRTAAARALTLLAAAVRLVASVIGALILLHAVFVFFEANPANPLVEFTTGVRDSLGAFTKDLFAPSDPKIAETINDALAAIVYIVVGNLVSQAVTRLAPSTKAKSKA